MPVTTETQEWRRLGLGGPPEPWAEGDQRDLDRLATSYYLDILELRGAVLASRPPEELWLRIEEFCMAATRHKHEIDYSLRHAVTPAERDRAEERLGSLMRLSRRMHAFVDDPGHAPGAVFEPDETSPA